MGRLNAVQERQYKRHRSEGSDLSRMEWMKSTLLTTREKRCLTRAWTRRTARLDTKSANRHAYLKRRVVEVEGRATKNSGHIARLRKCTSAGIAELLSDDDKDEGGSGDDGADADGPAEDEEEDTKVSPAQMARLYSQAVAVLDVLEEERMRDLLIVEHTRTALIALEQHLDSSSSAAQSTAAEILAKKAMEEASIVRLNNSLMPIAEKVSEKSARKFYPETILSRTSQFFFVLVHLLSDFVHPENFSVGRMSAKK